MTPAEWQRLGEEGIGGLPRRQLPLVLGMVMYRADGSSWSPPTRTPSMPWSAT
jgi:hypothetical protein